MEKVDLPSMRSSEIDSLGTYGEATGLYIGGTHPFVSNYHL